MKTLLKQANVLYNGKSDLHFRRNGNCTVYGSKACGQTFPVQTSLATSAAFCSTFHGKTIFDCRREKRGKSEKYNHHSSVITPIERRVNIQRDHRLQLQKIFSNTRGEEWRNSWQICRRAMGDEPPGNQVQSWRAKFLAQNRPHQYSDQMKTLSPPPFKTEESGRTRIWRRQGPRKQWRSAFRIRTVSRVRKMALFIRGGRIRRRRLSEWSSAPSSFPSGSALHANPAAFADILAAPRLASWGWARFGSFGDERCGCWSSALRNTVPCPTSAR